MKTMVRETFAQCLKVGAWMFGKDAHTLATTATTCSHRAYALESNLVKSFCNCGGLTQQLCMLKAYN
jgi:hypothetical protein